MQAKSKERVFRYPLHLWLFYLLFPYFFLCFSIFMTAFNAHMYASHHTVSMPRFDGSMLHSMLQSVMVILILEFLALRRMPVTIRISGNKAELIRFHPYFTLALTDIEQVAENLVSPAFWSKDKFTRVRIRTASYLKTFYIPQSMKGYDELLELLRSANDGAEDPETFSFSKKGIEGLWRNLFILYVAPMFVFFVGLDFGLQHSLIGRYAVVLAVSAVVYLLVRLYSMVVPVRVELYEDKIAFEFLFGRRIVRDMSDISDVRLAPAYMGASITAPATIIKFRDGMQLSLSRHFENYDVLKSRLEKMSYRQLV